MHIRRDVESVGVFNKHQIDSSKNAVVPKNPTTTKTDAFVQNLIKTIAGFALGAGAVFVAGVFTGGVGIGVIIAGGVAGALIAVITDVALRALGKVKGKVVVNPPKMMNDIRTYWQQKDKNDLIKEFQNDFLRDTYHLKKEIISEPLKDNASKEEKAESSLRKIGEDLPKIKEAFGTPALINIACIAQQAFNVDALVLLNNEAQQVEEVIKLKNPNVVVIIQHIKNEYFLNETKDGKVEIYIFSRFNHLYFDQKKNTKDYTDFRTAITKISVDKNELNNDYSFVGIDDLEAIAPSLKVTIMYSDNCKTLEEADKQVLTLNKIY
ncbi:MAG: hypothetical protein Q8K60_05665 [Parachlamydiaceae bacterium]|nr:hypothetical protein [Parachlamydiaceae bacterium]